MGWRINFGPVSYSTRRSEPSGWTILFWTLTALAVVIATIVASI